MFELYHHALLVGSVCCLGSASLRAAAVAAPAVAFRVLAAAPLAVATAITESLALGVVSLGTNPIALAVAAAATYLAARRLLPPPRERVLDAVRSTGSSVWPVGGALVGASLAFVVWLWHYPNLGIDALAYHLPQVVSWVHSGRPGTVREFIYVLPVGNYPQANEVLLAWSAGLARSFSVVAPWNLAMLWLLAGSTWVGARALGATRLVAGLAAAALCLSPLVVGELSTAGTDLPAFAWLACAAALAAGSREHPGLLAPALVAAGLSVGTKTTTAAPAAIALSVGLWQARSELRSLVPALTAAATLALAVGATWYVRNLVSHGSPLWPLVATPWGDPVPPFVSRVDYSLLDRPSRTLSGHLDEYEMRIAGGLLLLAGGICAPLISRSRAVLGAAAATLLAAFLWASAPATGIGDIPDLHGLALTTARYLLPAIGTGTVALILASTARRKVPVALLGAAAAWSAARSLRLGFPERPSLATLLAGAALGVAAALVVRPGMRQRLAAVALPLLAVGAGALAAHGYLNRHVRVHSGLTRNFAPYLAGQPGFATGDGPVYMAPGVSAILAGDRLGHDVRLIPANEPCPGVVALTRRNWVVVTDRRPSYVPAFTAPRCLGSARPASTEGVTRIYK